jgi:hypothetical protein
MWRYNITKSRTLPFGGGAELVRNFHCDVDF